MADEDSIFEIGNHQKIRRILQSLSGRKKFPWYDRAVGQACQQFFLLANVHLRAANTLGSFPSLWRSRISRCYYAAYSASRCIRWFTRGIIKKDSEDHKHVGDLPDDFPNKDIWGSFLVDLHKDRNLADYEPGKSTRKNLNNNLERIFPETQKFVRAVKKYLNERGVEL